MIQELEPLKENQKKSMFATSITLWDEIKKKDLCLLPFLNLFIFLGFGQLITDEDPHDEGKDPKWVWTTFWRKSKPNAGSTWWNQRHGIHLSYCTETR